MKSKDKTAALSRLIPFIMQYKWPLIGSAIAYFFAGALQALLGKTLQYFIDGLSASENYNLYLACIALPVLVTIQSISTWIGSYLTTKTTWSVIDNFRSMLFHHSLRLPYSHYEQHNRSNLVSKVMYDASQLQQILGSTLRSVLSEGFKIVGILAWMFWLNWQYTFMMIAILPIFALLVMKARDRFKRLAKRMQGDMGQIAQAASEALGNIEIVRSFGGEEYEGRKFEHASLMDKQARQKMASMQGLLNLLLQTIFFSLLGVVLFLLVFFREDATAGELISYVVAAAMLPGSVRRIASVVSHVAQGLASVESMFAYLDLPPEVNEGRLHLESTAGSIEIENLCFSYDEKPILKNINLNIAAKSKVALVGASGSGKTTLSRLIARYYPYQGSIKINRHNINEYDLADFRRKISVVSQNISLFHSTLRENIAYGAQQGSSDQQIIKAATQAGIHEHIRSLPDGYDTMLGEGGAKLSGGQKQRISIARAILKNSSILILDEATSALDADTENIIKLTLKDIGKDKTVIVIAHRLSTIIDADNIVFLHNGEIVEQGTHQELIAAKGRYYKSYRVQDDV